MDRKTAREAPGGPAGLTARPHLDGQAVLAPDSWPDRGDHPEPRSRLHITVTPPPGTLRLAGEIDESTVGALTRALTRARRSGDFPIRVDMGGVEYCDVAGLRAIVFPADGRGPGPGAAGETILAHLPAHLATVLHILGWDATPGLTLAELGHE